MNWTDFFDDNFIPYTRAGPNTSPGWVSIQCPFCGDDDPSMHMGISLSGGHWQCWRYATHRGVKPYKLLNALAAKYPLGMRTAAIVETYNTPNPDAFDLPLRSSGKQKGIPKVMVGLNMPVDAMPINPFSSTGKFWSYLVGRGFEPLQPLLTYYHIRACLLGKWSGRIILPVYYPSYPTLIGWQARAISERAYLRYKSSGTQVKRVLFNSENVKSGNTLYVCEGPIDALKIDYYGMNSDCRAVAVMGVEFTVDQAIQLQRLKSNFKRTIVLFDPDAAGLASGFELSDYVSGLELASVPEGLEDIGAATPKQIKEFLNES